jgi:hypothetical protein
LYVRLFQRKFKWHCLENISYERISANLEDNLQELLDSSFLIDEACIDTYEEIIYLLKLPQLKELAKSCHILNQTQTKARPDFIKLLLQHFKSQKYLKFSSNSKEKSPAKPNAAAAASSSHFMNQCKKILGKCYKLEKTSRSVFVRILLLYSLSSSYHNDQNNEESGQQKL